MNFRDFRCSKTKRTNILDYSMMRVFKTCVPGVVKSIRPRPEFLQDIPVVLQGRRLECFGIIRFTRHAPILIRANSGSIIRLFAPFKISTTE